MTASYSAVETALAKINRSAADSDFDDVNNCTNSCGDTTTNLTKPIYRCIFTDFSEYNFRNNCLVRAC